MKSTTLLYAIFAASVLCFGVVAMIVFNISPDDAGIVGLGALLVSFFAGVLGISTLISYYARQRFGSAHYDDLGTAFRTGALAATSVTGLLILEGLRALSLISGALFVVAVFSSEIYLRSRVRHR